MNSGKVTKSFRIDNTLWAEFSAYCRLQNRTISDVLEGLVKDFMKKNVTSETDNLSLFEDRLRVYNKQKFELKKVGKAIVKEFGKDTFEIIRDHYRQLGGKDDLSNFDEIRPLLFKNPLDVSDEAILSFCQYASLNKKCIEIKEQLLQLGKSSGSPVKIDQNNAERVENSKELSETKTE